MTSIFTKIINREIPCFKIYEDAYTFAFLDIHPIKPGHTLIVPKVEIDYFVDVPEPYYSAVFATAKKIAPAIQKATGCVRIATLIIGFEVPHFHYHLIPANTIADVRSAPQQATQEELQSMHKKVISFL